MSGLPEHKRTGQTDKESEMTTTPNPKASGAKSDAKAQTRKPRTPAPSIDFGKIAAKASETPVVQTRGSALDNSPVPAWLKESWDKRSKVMRGQHERTEGAAVDLSPMSREQVDYIKNLMTRAVQRMPGVGVKFAETKTADGIVLKFQTMERKTRTAKAAK